MKKADMEDISFVLHQNKPTIQKDGVVYEILLIHEPEGGTITLDTIPRYNWKLVHLTVDKSFRKTSLNHLKDIVKREIVRLGRWD